MTSEQMARRRAGLNGLIGWHMVRRAKDAILHRVRNLVAKTIRESLGARCDYLKLAAVV
jgi:hypothetical protein